MSLQDNHVFKLCTQMCVNDYGIQPEVLELVEERAHILFATLALFEIDFEIYMEKSEKIGGNLIEATTSLRRMVIGSYNL